MQNFCKST